MANQRPRRLLPEESLPPYSYVTGAHPHPTTDPAGHWYGRDEPQSTPLNAAEWSTCRAYLWGIDLFNYAYYWEAHESWEAAWVAAGRRGPTADFLKGLIKLAAAGVKLREGRPDGVRRHGRRGLELLEASRDLFSDTNPVFGISLGQLIKEVEATLEDVATSAAGFDPQRALPWRLCAELPHSRE